MRLCDFIRHLHGNLIVEIFAENEDGCFKKLLKENSINDLTNECNQSFNILRGFDCELWEMQVVGWSIWDNIVTIAVSK